MRNEQHDLLQSVSWAVEETGWLSDALTAVEDDLDCALTDDAVARLCARRGFDDGRTRQILDIVHWLVAEIGGQLRDLAEQLQPALEPAHGVGTRYGKATGVFPFSAFDDRRCGSMAGVGRHRRRGQDLCVPCARAACHYNRLRRQRSSPIGPQEMPLITIAS